LWASNTNSGNGAYTYGNTVGLYAIDRTNSTTADFYSAGVATGNHDTGTTAALNNKNFLVLANWNAALSAVANFSNGTVAAFTAGTSLGAAGQLAVFNRMHTALNALSAANFP
jgi:hypothetical protein